MATVSLLVLQFELRDIRIGEEVFPNKLILSRSSEIPRQILDSFKEQSFNLGRFLFNMGLKKVTFKSSLENLKSSTIVKICEAISRLGDAKRMKDVTEEMLAEHDPESFIIDTARKSVDKAVKEYQEAQQAYLDECALRKIQVITSP